MNPFKSRKKSPAEADDGPSIPRGMTFRRKKQQQQPKLELDLASALPSTENFRTSLLMPNLSARFSMLRDQDDPHSMMGKANDDSVLFAPRHSRLNYFGDNNLSDIAEVASMTGSSIRPPFATDRTNSVASMDGYDTDGGASVMSRSKPGQGNKFFGGRQKIYKVPLTGVAVAGDARAEATPSPRPMGKAVYEDDVSLSAFQALRQKEKEERSLGDLDHETDRRRETSSSTTSGPPYVRTSTAATSVASQSASSLYGVNGAANPNAAVPPIKQALMPAGERVGPKNKRLYGQGLDQQIHEQQSSAMHRLDTIQRTRHAFPPTKTAMQTRSATNLHDRFQRGPPTYPSTTHVASPPPSGEGPGSAGFDFAMAEAHAADDDHHHPYGRYRPLSPPMSPDGVDATFVAALEPNDLGKATASGAFNKPKTAYNEQQFAQRQLQLQEGRETPPPRALSRNDVHDEPHRLRHDSSVSTTSGRSAGSGRGPLAQPSAAPVPALTVTPKKERPAAMDASHASNGTFLSGFSDGDSEPASPLVHTGRAATSDTPPRLPPASSHHRYQHDHEHPAFQPASQGGYSFMDLMDTPTAEPTADPMDHAPRASDEEEGEDRPAPASSGNGDGLGLNGLIKNHLRNLSNVSSVYPSSPPRPSFLDDAMRAGDAESHHDWHDDAGVAHHPSTTMEPMPPDALQSRARHILEQANQLRGPAPKAEQVLGPRTADKAQQVLGAEAPRRSHESSGAPWQEQLKAHHSRGMSNDTQKERDDFATELADRRRRVRDNLKSVVDADHAAPPSPGAQRGLDSPGKPSSGAFGLLRKASRDAMTTRNDAKAKKMLGMGMPPASGASPRLGHDGQSDHEDRARIHASARAMQPSPRPHEAPRPAPTHERRAGYSDGRAAHERNIAAERREKYRNQSAPAVRPFDDRRDRAAPRPLDQQRSHSESTRAAPGSRHAPPGAPAAFLPRPREQPAPPASFRPAGHARKYSPPRDAVPHASPKPHLPLDARSSPALHGSAFSTTANPYHAAYPAPATLGQRTAPTALPAQQHYLPPPTTVSAASTSPAPLFPPSPHPSFPPSPSRTPMPPTAATGRLPSAHKRVVHKEDISEPVFISTTSTSSVRAIDPQYSLANGMDDVRAEAAAAAAHGSAPPLPAFHPRRRRPTLPHNPVGNASAASSRRPSNADEYDRGPASAPLVSSAASSIAGGSRPRLLSSAQGRGPASRSQSRNAGMVGSSIGGRSSGGARTNASSRSQSRSQTSGSPPEGERQFLGGAEVETASGDPWFGDQWAAARDEVGVFAADEGLGVGGIEGGRLRKVSSEGGNMSVRARERGVIGGMKGSGGGGGLSGLSGSMHGAGGPSAGLNGGLNGSMNRDPSGSSPVLTGNGAPWGGARVKAGMF